MVGGCTSEVSEVVADGRPIRTIAIESEDPAAVVAAVRSVGLWDYANTSYPRGLSDLIDEVPQQFAVIDMGTNSIKFHIGERAADGSWHRVVDRAEVTRLGEGLAETGEIGAAAIERAVTAIAAMVAEARQHDVRAIAAVATAGMRMAGNSAEVVAAIQAGAGVTVTVIPGEEETRLAFLAVELGLGLAEGPMVVFDTGGGSSQFTFGHGHQVDEQFSVDVGAVRYTERFGLGTAVSTEVLQAALAPSPPTWRGSTGARRPTRWWAWAARSRTSPP